MTRWFGPDCEIVGHEIGDRHWEIGTRDQEWTGTTWAMVCHRCDRPMTGRDPQGWLNCAHDGTYFRDVPVREVAP